MTCKYGKVMVGARGQSATGLYFNSFVDSALNFTVHGRSGLAHIFFCMIIM